MKFQTVHGEKDRYVIESNEPPVDITFSGYANADFITDELFVYVGTTVICDTALVSIHVDSIRFIVNGQELPLTGSDGPYLTGKDSSKYGITWIFKERLSKIELPVDKDGIYQQIPIDIYLRRVFPTIPNDILPETIKAFSRNIAGRRSK